MRISARAIAGAAIIAAAWLSTAHAGNSALKGTITGGAAPGTLLENAVVMIEGPSLPAAAEAPHARMAQQNDTFVPRVMAIGVGTTVDFPNDDPRLHNILSTSPPKPFDLGMYGQNESKSITFDSPGIVQVRCADHPMMEGFIVVHANPYLAASDRNGAYTISNVPEGRYRVRVWHEKHRERELWVNTSAGQVTPLDVRLAR